MSLLDQVVDGAAGRQPVVYGDRPGTLEVLPDGYDGAVEERVGRAALGADKGAHEH